MTKQLKTIEILNASKSATCSMWRYPESAKIFQYRGMDFDRFRVVRDKADCFKWQTIRKQNGMMYTYLNCVVVFQYISGRPPLFFTTQIGPKLYQVVQASRLHVKHTRMMQYHWIYFHTVY